MDSVNAYTPFDKISDEELKHFYWIGMRCEWHDSFPMNDEEAEEMLARGIRMNEMEDELKRRGYVWTDFNDSSSGWAKPERKEDE